MGGVQLSVGVEMEACGDQAAAASDFASTLVRSQAGNHVNQMFLLYHVKLLSMMVFDRAIMKSETIAHWWNLKSGC